MGDYIEPLDFKKILLDLFLGHPAMLAFASIILISFLSAKFHMTNRNFLLTLVICSLMLTAYLGEAIYIIILIVIGVVTFYSLSRMFV